MIRDILILALEEYFMSVIAKGLVDSAFTAVGHVLDTADVAYNAAEDSVVDAAEIALRAADHMADMTEAELMAYARRVLERVQDVVHKAIEPLP